MGRRTIARNLRTRISIIREASGRPQVPVEMVVLVHSHFSSQCGNVDAMDSSNHSARAPFGAEGDAKKGGGN
jgi:hypothetical protein